MYRAGSCTKLQGQFKLLAYFQIPISSCVTKETINAVALQKWNVHVEQGNTVGEMTALIPDKNRILLIPVSITVLFKKLGG